MSFLKKYMITGSVHGESGSNDDETRTQHDQPSKEQVKRPGSMADDGAQAGDLDGGGGIGQGTKPDPHLDNGDTGPTPDKADI